MPDRVGRRDRPTGFSRASKAIVNVRDMTFNGPHAERKLLGDLAVGEALSDQSDYLTLTPCQRDLRTLGIDSCDSPWGSPFIKTPLGTRRIGGLSGGRCRLINLRD